MHQNAYNYVDKNYYKPTKKFKNDVVLAGSNNNIVSTGSNSNIFFLKNLKFFNNNPKNNSDSEPINPGTNLPSFFLNDDGNENNVIATITDEKTGNIYGLGDPIDVVISDGVFNISLSVPGATSRAVYDIYLLDLSGIENNDVLRASLPLNDEHIFINPGKIVDNVLDEVIEGTTYLITEIYPRTYNDNYIYFANRSSVSIKTEIKDTIEGITYILVDNIPESIPAESPRELLIKISPAIDSITTTCFNIYPENVENDPIRDEPLNKDIIKLVPGNPITLSFPNIYPKKFYGIYSIDCN